VGWRYTSLPTEGAPGPTHAIDFSVQPFARSRLLPRHLRLSVGAELALREGSHQRTDGIVWARLAAGAQLPGRVFTPYVGAVLYAGVASRYRAGTTVMEGASTLGLEAGADARFLGAGGVGLALGVGRTVIGPQYSYAAWIRVSLGLW
jgi:hypothetical protein